MTLRYDLVATPFGDALAVFSETGIARFELTSATDNLAWLLERIAVQSEAPVNADPGAADELARLVDAFFDGEPIDFREHLRFDWRFVSGFALKALQVIADIPWAQTLSYGEVAALAGRERAARAVGTACRLTPFSLIVPVHRVVRSDGTPGQYGSHPERKLFLLDLERDAARERA